MAGRAPRHHGCIGIVCILLLGFVARDASAQIYTVEIRPVLNDLQVKIEQVPQRSLLVIKLTNNESTRVRCVLNFDASPQTPRRSTRHQSRRGDLERVPGATSLVQRHRRRDLPTLVLRELAA